MESRESFEQFADALGGRRRRAQAMVRSLKRMAASADGGASVDTDSDAPAFDGLSAATRATPPSRPAVVFDDAATLAEEAIEDLGDAELVLWQQNEALFEAQVQLDERSRHYQTLFELAPAAYVVTNGAGVILELNELASTLLHRPRNFAVGKPLALFVEAGAERASFKRALDRLRTTDETQVWPVRLSPGGRGRVEVNVSVRAGRDDQGAATTLYWLLRDESALADADLL